MKTYAPRFSPEKQNSRYLRFFSELNRSRLLTILFFTTAFLLKGAVSYGQLVDCHCTSNDVTAVTAHLSKDENGTPLTSSDCQGGDTQQAYLTFEFTATASQRPGAYAQVTYKINDGASETIEQCFKVIYSGNSSLSLHLPDYVCGDKVEIVSTLFAWGNGNGQVTADKFCDEGVFQICDDVTPKCFQPASPPILQAPLIANFTYLPDCDGLSEGNTQKIKLTGSASGGVGPYTYSWDTNNDGTDDAFGEEITVTGLLVGSPNIRLTVTDSQDVPATDAHEAGIVVGTCTLPVTYSYIRMFPSSEGGVEIEWETTGETDHAYYQIEKAVDIRNFVKAGPQISKASLIRPDGRKVYRYLDRDVSNRVYYYRLKQVDTDGTFSYSKLYSVSLDSRSTDIVIAPNPARETFGIDLKNCLSGDYNVELRDMNGRIIRSLNVRSNQLTRTQKMDVRNLSAGSYILVAQSSDRVYVKTVLIQ